MMDTSELVGRFERAILQKYGQVKAFCDATGLAPSIYYNLRSRRKGLPSLENFVIFCKALDLSADELLGLNSISADSNILSPEERDLIKLIRGYEVSPESFRKLFAINEITLKALASGGVTIKRVNDGGGNASES